MCKILVAIVVATCALVQSGIADNFTISQFTGDWLNIARFYATDADPNINNCDWMKIEGDNNNPKFFNGTYLKCSADRSVAGISGNGRIDQSKIYFIPSVSPTRMEVYIPWSFDNGNDLILIHEAKIERSELISRKYPASLQARAEFERLAGEISRQVFYINHNTACCSH